MKTPKAKTTSLKIIAILLPVFAIFIIELILRLFDFGYSTKVFLEEKSKNGQPFLYLNPDITKKYFTYTANSTIGNKEYFPKVKPNNTFRIFVLGESTTIGYPYGYNGTFSRMLKYKLQFSYPNTNFEVINLGITAINSYAILDFTRAIVNCQPDAVLVYMGHNEYYGALGAGSSNRLGINPAFVNFLITAKKLKVVQAFMLGYGKIMTLAHKDATNQYQNLMKRMAQQKVPLNSKLYKAGASQFTANLEKILKTYQKHKVPVFISTLASNEKDQVPFISETTNSQVNNAWKQYYSKALQQLKDNETDSAFEALSRANAIDSSYALIQYHIGKISYDRGNYAYAKKCFFNAKELDLLRFRAPDEFNAIIKKQAEKYNAHLIDSYKQLQMNSPHAIIGENFMLEHLHPNIAGHFVIANTFFASLQNVIKSDKCGLDETEYRRSYPLTTVDSIKGAIQISMLKEGWPFNEKPATGISEKSTYEAKIAGAYAVKQINWHQAMAMLWDYYEKTQNIQGLLKISEAFILEYPYESRYYIKASELCHKVGNTFKANFYLNKSQECCSN